MKAQIVKIADLKKTRAEFEAERLLLELNSDKAIKVSLQGSETPRKINRIFRKAAEAMGKTITARTKNGTVVIRLKTQKLED